MLRPVFPNSKHNSERAYTSLYLSPNMVLMAPDEEWHKYQILKVNLSHRVRTDLLGPLHLVS